jgi:A/G-specific adenine glycosylase
VIKWGREHYADFPWRSTKSPWEALAAEVLLQRTRASQVIPTYEEFVERYPAPEFLARESPEGLLRTTGRLGLRWRAPLMIRMAQELVRLDGPPTDHASLAKLPGVGPYAAAAYLSLHRRRRAVIVDANVVRWLGRTFGFETGPETRRAPWLVDLADRLTPSRVFREYNYAVLDLSMQVCRSRPRCEHCPLAQGFCHHAASRP